MPNQDSEASKTPQVNSVLHAVRILELFGSRQKESMSLTEISRELQMHKTTVYRILRTLQSVGWIEQSSASGLYRLGTGILTVSSAVGIHRTERDLISEEMQKLSERFGEIVVLAAVRKDTGICIDLIKSHYGLSLTTAIGYIVPFHAGATGKTLLAAQEEETVRRLLRAFSGEEAAALRRQVETIRREGYCRTENEVEQGAAAVAVPLAGQDETYALSISGPVERIRNIGYEVLRGALTAAAENIRLKNKAMSMRI